MIYDFIVVGAGQAGLSIAYYLKRTGYHFLVIDGDDEIGGSWKRRWDSLKLFTPTQYNHLPGLPFPAEFGAYPGKQAVANYLRQYVDYFQIPVRLNFPARKMTKTNDCFTIQSDHGSVQSRQVIVATGPFHVPSIPSFAQQLSDDVLQLHSSEYKNPQQLQSGETLVVGGGDSGVQILQELAGVLPKVYFSGECGTMVLPQEFLGKTLWWWLLKLGILGANKYSWLGKRLAERPQPIIGTNVKRLFAKQNVELVGRALSAQDNQVNCEKQTLSGIKNVIWATGFKPDFDWIENITLDEKGYPLNRRGISQLEGLYFIGLPWMYTRSSATLGGVQQDAQYLIEHFIEQEAVTQ